MLPTHQRFGNAFKILNECGKDFGEILLFDLLHARKRGIGGSSRLVNFDDAVKEGIDGIEMLIDKVVDRGHEEFFSAKTNIISKILKDFGDENERPTSFFGNVGGEAARVGRKDGGAEEAKEKKSANRGVFGIRELFAHLLAEIGSHVSERGGALIDGVDDEIESAFRGGEKLLHI